jgi:hypothetical protein
MAARRRDNLLGLGGQIVGVKFLYQGCMNCFWDGTAAAGRGFKVCVLKPHDG